MLSLARRPKLAQARVSPVHPLPVQTEQVLPSVSSTSTSGPSIECQRLHLLRYILALVADAVWFNSQHFSARSTERSFPRALFTQTRKGFV